MMQAADEHEVVQGIHSISIQICCSVLLVPIAAITPTSFLMMLQAWHTWIWGCLALPGWMYRYSQVLPELLIWGSGWATQGCSHTV